MSCLKYSGAEQEQVAIPLDKAALTPRKSDDQVCVAQVMGHTESGIAAIPQDLGQTDRPGLYNDT